LAKDNLIWILGARNDNADRSIQWDEEFPNFADPDVLIVNLSSLNRNLRDSIDTDKLFHARDAIYGRFKSGGILVFITASHPERVRMYLGGFAPLYEDIVEIKNNQPVYDLVYHPIDFLCPFDMETYDIPRGFELRYKQNHPFSNYLRHVKKFDFLLYAMGLSKLTMWLGLKTVNPSESGIKIIQNDKITDKAGNLIGVSCRLNRLCKGKLIFLPPTTEIPIEEGINDILKRYDKGTSGNFPQWVDNIPFSGLSKINCIINELKSKRNLISEKISLEERNRHVLRDHYRLLFDTDKSLVDAVKNAFKVLGFNNLKEGRGPDKEDLVFEFTTSKGLNIAVIEVKGLEGRLKKSHIDQCHGWVTEYEGLHQSAKGVLIPNQFRSKPYLYSKKDREDFNFNLRHDAEVRKICILPSSVLFEAVNTLLKGNKIGRIQPEQRIAETNGVLFSLTK
jgi:hypothetical protein